SADPAFAIRASTMLVLDHARQAAELQGPSEAALDAWLARHGQALESGSPWTPSKPGEARPPGAPKSRGAATENDEFAGPAQTDPVWRASDPDYLRQIEQCKHAISEGQ